MKIECIVEQGSKENISYVGFVQRETDDFVVLVFFNAQRAKPPFQTIKKARILERYELRRYKVRAAEPEAIAS